MPKVKKRNWYYLPITLSILFVFSYFYTKNFFLLLFILAGNFLVASIHCISLGSKLFRLARWNEFKLSGTLFVFFNLICILATCILVLLLSFQSTIVIQNQSQKEIRRVKISSGKSERVFDKKILPGGSSRFDLVTSAEDVLVQIEYENFTFEQAAIYNTFDSSKHKIFAGKIPH